MGKGGKLKEVEQLISIDGDKGYLPFDEVNDIPTNDIVSSDQIDDVLMMFDEMDIDVVEDQQGLKSEGERILDKEEEGEELDVGSLGRASDPVRMYLREMGSVSLLTRDGEVEIAKRIESGQREILSIVLNWPMAVKEVIHLGQAIKGGRVDIRDVTDEIDEEASSEEEQAHKKKLLDFIEKIRRHEEAIRRALKNKGTSRSKIQEQVRKKQKEILDCLQEMKLKESQIDKIVQKMKQMLIRMEKAETEMRRIEEKWKISVKEARVLLKKIRARSLSEKKLLQSRGFRKSRSSRNRSCCENSPKEDQSGGGRVLPLRGPTQGIGEGDRWGRDQGEGGKSGVGEGELEVGRVDRQEVYESGAPIPRSDSRGKHRPDEGRGQV